MIRDAAVCWWRDLRRRNTGRNLSRPLISDGVSFSPITWQYRVVETALCDARELARVGSDGWELVAVIQRAQGEVMASHQAVLYLKRPFFAAPT